MELPYKSPGTLDWYFDAADILQATDAEFVLMVRHPKTKVIWSISRLNDKYTADCMMDSYANILGKKFGEGWYGTDETPVD